MKKKPSKYIEPLRTFPRGARVVENGVCLFWLGGKLEDRRFGTVTGYLRDAKTKRIKLSYEFGEYPLVRVRWDGDKKSTQIQENFLDRFVEPVEQAIAAPSDIDGIADEDIIKPCGTPCDDWQYDMPSAPKRGLFQRFLDFLDPCW